MKSSRHEIFMRRALELAAKGEGLTRPNPPVGAVIVKNGRVIAEGWHKKAGTAHAERVALARAGAAARGAALYVTLEPCCTHGRTPPCTDAIIAAGIRTVIVASTDPNPKHRGRGFSALRRKGIGVIRGVCETEGNELIAPFAKWITTGRPMVTLKLGMSLDGKIADRNRQSKWITGPESRKRVQAMRRRVDAIMAGAGTVRADNPQLQPRPACGRKPWRVIVDVDGVIPAGARVLTDDAADRTVVAGRKLLAGRKAIQTIRLPARNPLRHLLQELGKMGILHALCEGGGELAAGLIAEECVDRFAFFTAPVLIGGVTSINSIGGRGWLMDSLPRVAVTGVEQIGGDILILAKPEVLRHSARLE